MAKWKASLDVGPDYLSADAITGCLRTSGNTLSVWCSDDDEQTKKSLLALGSSLTSIETVSYVILESDHLEKELLQLVESEGNTAALGSNFLHRDIVSLDHTALAKVAVQVKHKISTDDFLTLTKGDLKTMLIEGVQSGALDKDRLDKKLREALAKYTPM